MECIGLDCGYMAHTFSVTFTRSYHAGMKVIESDSK